jgi:hypothetical protein
MNELIMIPWLIDKTEFKSIPKQEILKAKYFSKGEKTIVFDFLGYSHSLSILEAFKNRGKEFSKIIFFGAASFMGDFKTGDIVFPESNFIFLRYEDRVSNTIIIDNDISNHIKKYFTNISADSMTIDYAGYFPTNELSMLKRHSTLFIEMEYGFILRWAIKNSINLFPIYILTDKWGDKVNIDSNTKDSFNKVINKILED